MSKAKTLTAMMQMFALEYIVDFNGKEAAIRAGYKPNYAGQQAHRLLNDDRVLAAIDVAITERKKRLYITQDTVLLKWWEIANADYNELSSVRRAACGYCYGGALTEDDEDETPVVDQNCEPDLDCIKCAGEGSPYVHIADTTKLSPTAKMLYQGAENTKFGIKINTADRMKALDNVARHLGMFKDTVDHTSSDGSMSPPQPLTPETAKVIDNELEDEY